MLGTVTRMVLSDHACTVACLETGAKPKGFARSPKVTVLLPWVEPNPVPVIVTCAPTAAWEAERELTLSAVGVTGGVTVGVGVGVGV
jgi:hypothetical protein